MSLRANVLSGVVIVMCTTWSSGGNAKTSSHKNRDASTTQSNVRPQEVPVNKESRKDLKKETSKGAYKDATKDASNDGYQLNLGLSLGYLTWEDRPQFDRWGTARAHLYTPCLGVIFNYVNATFDWAAGGYAGIGKGEVQFPDGFYDSKASVTMLSAFGSGLVQLSDSAAFGLEAMMIDLNLTANTSANSKNAYNNQEAALLAVGRFRFSNLELKFKGGSIVGGTSAMWGIELAYPFLNL